MSRRSNGEGTIYRDAARGEWRGSIALGGKRKSVRGRTKETVRAKLLELSDAYRRGATELDPKITVSDWLTLWLNGLEGRVDVTLKRRTFDTYSDAVRLYVDPEIGHIKLYDLRPEHLERWHVELLKRVSPTTATQAHRTLSSALQVALERGYLVRNVARLVRSPSRAHVNLTEALTTSQVMSLVDAVAHWPRLDMNPARIMLGAITGLRQGEALAITESDIDFETRTITINATLARPSWRHGPKCPGTGHTKGRCPERIAGPVTTAPKSRAARRRVVLAPPVLAAVETQLREVHKVRLRAGSQWKDRDNDWLFPGPMGQRPDISGDGRRWRELVTATLGKEAPTGTHAARRHAATAYAEKGVPLAETIRHFGWTRVDLAAIYYARVSDKFAADTVDMVWADLGKPKDPGDGTGSVVSLR